MFQKRRLFVLFLLLLALLTVLPSALAIEVFSIEPYRWSCDPGFPAVFVMLTFTGGGEPEEYREIFGRRVIDGDGDILHNGASNHTWTPGTEPEPTEFAYFLDAVPSQNPVTIEIIDLNIDHEPTGYVYSATFESPCAPSPNGNGNYNGADNGNGNHNGAYGTDNGNHNGADNGNGNG